MKKILLVLTALLAVWTAEAQESEGGSRWSVTPHVGMNVSRLGGSAEPDWFGTAVGPGAGVEAEWRFSRWLGLSLGVGYQFGLRGVCRGEAHLNNAPLYRHADYVYNRNLNIRLGYRINL